MKKFLILLFMILPLTSCSFSNNSFFEDDMSIAKSHFEKILEACQNRDKDAIKKLFSQNTINNVENIDKNISDLFEFFQGEITKYDDWGGPCVETGRNDGERQGAWKILQSTYDVVTNKGEYRFAIQECISDTGDPKNIGINSLYVIESEDSDMQYAYRGDGEWTQGIIIVTTHE